MAMRRKLLNSREGRLRAGYDYGKGARAASGPNLIGHSAEKDDFGRGRSPARYFYVSMEQNRPQE